MQIDTNGWLDVAIEVDVLENSFERGGHQPTHIVLHGTAGGYSAQAIGKFFQSTVGGNNPASSHFIIGVDGRIVQCVSCGYAAWGNGALINPRFAFPANVNPNLYTISIEHCKPSGDNSDVLTSTQQQASFELIRVLCDRYGIPKRAGDVAGGIISHADLDTVNRARCPGPYPWQGLWDYLQGGSKMLSINDMGQWCFGGDDNRWNFRSGYGVSHGILNYYRANNGILNLGVPRSDETSQMSGVAIQMFERGIVCYDPGHIIDRPPGSGDVYLLHLDSGIGQQMIAQPLIDALQGQIVALKAQLAQVQPAAIDALQGQIVALKARLTQIATLCQG